MLVLAGCGNLAGNNDEDVTYTVAANGGPNTATTALTFTFGSAVSGLTAEDINVTGVTRGALTGGGETWTLEITVTITANITVSIARNGIESGQKQVMVYKTPGTADHIPSDSLASALAWLDVNAAAGGEYIITIKENETIEPKTLSYDGKTLGVTLTGGNAEWIVRLNTAGSLFTVGSGVTLPLDAGVTLSGLQEGDNYAALVWVNEGGALVMNAGSKITGNRSFYNPAFIDSGNRYGGGVFVYHYAGTLIKSGQSTIYGRDAADAALKNTASFGHAVYRYLSWNPSFSDVYNTTAGPGVNLRSLSDVTGTGGWEQM
ncbi:MAG: hypothetical protein LBG24_02610 [Treponema sp.]|nr:hypothetical protein [Treponema sp.]